MKKLLIVGVIPLFIVILALGYADAGLRCDVCHTMHYSQNGGVPAGAQPGGPHPILLLGTCMGCHSDTSTSTIKVASAGNIPQVFNTGGGTQDPGTANSWAATANMNLAGGNFYYVVNGPSNAKGHNVDVTGVAADTTILPLGTPPGYDAAYDTSTVKYKTASRLTCAGSNGCHGDRNIDSSAGGAGASLAALNGAHHDAPPIDGSTVGKSYRFLKGILGREDPDWQQSASVSDHNEYEGALVQNAPTTISYLCGQCHGNFHASAGIGGGTPSNPWLRHPTDIDVISKSGEYAKYNDIVGAGNPYSLEAPVGYAGTGVPGGIPSTRSAVTSGDSIVICLSCHRAHASLYDDILRWDYATMQAGGGGANGTGCFRCHTAKDGSP
jgi:hypothetical protein